MPNVLDIATNYHDQVTVDGETFYRARFGIKTGYRKDDWEVCVACGESFPTRQMVPFRGAWYGVPCTCAKDIYSILRNETEQYHGNNEQRELSTLHNSG
jgi:hypothetical protein